MWVTRQTSEQREGEGWGVRRAVAGGISAVGWASVGSGGGQEPVIGCDPWQNGGTIQGLGCPQCFPLGSASNLDLRTLPPCPDRQNASPEVRVEEGSVTVKFRGIGGPNKDG